MVSQDILIDEAAAYKKESRSHFDEALALLLALAWERRDGNFDFRADTDTWDEAMRICINLSDKCEGSALKHLRTALADLADEADAWMDVNERENLESFDMAGVHLLDLLAVWIGVAAVNGWTQGYTRVMITRYIHNPYLCPAWRDIPQSALAWGRGYAKDIPEQLALIGQGIIIGGARYVEWERELGKGATYYIRRRGSNYDCPVCESLANIPIPIDEPFVPSHPRCVCRPEYHYEPMP